MGLECIIDAYYDYGPFGNVLDGRKGGNGYRYGFNGKEGDNETYGNNNEYDFGARMYDPRIGRWMSIDAMSGKYPSLSPYHFALNSPILFKDPNGYEGEITIIKNPNGGGKIIVSSTFYITGAGASPEAAIAYQTEFDNIVKNGSADFQGEHYEVEFNVKFEYVSDKSAITLQDGDNIIYVTNNGSRAHAGGMVIKHHDEIHPEGQPPIIKEWWTASIGYEAILGYNKKRDAVHEALHLLGLSDRYQDVEPADGERKYSLPDKGYEGDIMGQLEPGFSQTHIDNYVSFFANKPAGVSILKESVDVDLTNGKLKNGIEPQANPTNKSYQPIPISSDVQTPEESN